MSIVSKSPRKVVLAAFVAATKVLPLYAHRFSPKKFTQAQLFACLVLKTFMRTDYRGVCEMLNDWPDIMNAIGMKNIPHFTTLQKTERRLLCSEISQRLLVQTVTERFKVYHLERFKMYHPKTFITTILA